MKVCGKSAGELSQRREERASTNGAQGERSQAPDRIDQSLSESPMYVEAITEEFCLATSKNMSGTNWIIFFDGGSL